MKDKTFKDDLVTRFQKNIYGSRKGKIRFAVLWDYLENQLLPQLGDNALHVLDAGCGLGQVSSRLLELGHSVSLCDISDEMLEQARTSLAAPAHSRATFIHSSIQDLPDKMDSEIQLILCHAVLEWMSEPKQALEKLSRLANKGTRLSLMFYNKDALIFRNLIRGNWRKVQSGELAGEPGGLTPINPLTLHQVRDWLEQYGFDVGESLGLRTFFDYLPKSLQEERELADILELEQEYARRSPYKEMARYIHLSAVKKS